LDEQAYRYNSRKLTDGDRFDEMTSRVMSDKPRDRFTDLLTRLLRVPKREINAKEQQYPDA
jgi:hypothetical protein